MARLLDLRIEPPTTTIRSLLHHRQLRLIAAILVFAFLPIDASQIQADDAHNTDQNVLRVISYNMQKSSPLEPELILKVVTQAA